jgi:hypothetical protein
LFTFVQPRAWIHLQGRPGLLGRLSQNDIATDSACDLLFLREGEQFRGATVGHKCIDTQTKGADYIDYQLLVGRDLYWYRRRALRKSDGEVREEIIGFNFFELNTTQLYTCRIDWAATGQAQDLRPLLRLDLQDQGGHGRFVTPDGRRLELTLHSDDWPYAAERDALILVVQEQGAETPFAIAWASVDEGDVQLSLDWLRVRCGPVVPDNDELLTAVEGRRGGGSPGTAVLVAGLRDSRLPYQGIDILYQHRIEARRHFHHQEGAGVIQYISLEAGQGLADAGLISGPEVGVDG